MNLDLALCRRAALRLSYTPKIICWGRWEESNPQHSVYETAALTS